MQYDENAEKYGYEGEMTPLKCDELKAYKGDVYIPVYGSIADADVYLKKDADTAIAELKDVIHELQVDLEEAKATAYTESVDAGMRERRLRRALYKACANWARSERYTEATWHGDEHREELWAEVQEKCRAKAEEYR